LQRLAQQQKLGMWGAVEKIDSADAAKYIDQVRLVCGRVIGSGSHSSAVFLDLGRNGQKDFTILIYKDALKYFRSKNIDPLAFLQDKLVQVSGRVREHDGRRSLSGPGGNRDFRVRRKGNS